MKNLILILALLFGGASAALAQTEPPQSRIVDLNGSGVSGMMVKAVAVCGPSFFNPEPPPSVSAMTSTDADGRFAWPVVYPELVTRCFFPVGVRPYYVTTYTITKDGYIFTRGIYHHGIGNPGQPSYDDRLALIYASNLPGWTNVSAASFVNDQFITNEMIVAGFGQGLALRTEVASLPLPTTLAGRRVSIRDSAGVEKMAPLLFAAPGQINYIIPEGLADGPAQIRLLDENNNTIKLGLADVRKVSASVFTANADGKGVPAANVIRVKPGNVQVYEPVAQFDANLRRFVPVEIDLGSADEFLILTIYGTGWRQVASVEAVSVAALYPDGQIGGRPLYSAITCPVEYAGKQPTLAGLDQINVRLSRNLIGKGEVELRVRSQGREANVTTLKFK